LELLQLLADFLSQMLLDMRRRRYREPYLLVRSEIPLLLTFLSFLQRLVPATAKVRQLEDIHRAARHEYTLYMKQTNRNVEELRAKMRDAKEWTARIAEARDWNH
jgi:hypothetical protein